MSAADPERFDLLVDHLRTFQPELFEDLALTALDEGDLSEEACAVVLSTDLSSLTERLETYRESDNGNPIAIALDDFGVARLTRSRLAVWEVVREYRLAGSLDSTEATFAGITPAEVRAALKYAEQHEEEINKRIAAYDDFQERAKAAYPFS